MKQKVIALLEPYRDKTLSFGCEVEMETTVYAFSKKKLSELYKAYGHSLSEGDYQALQESQDYDRDYNFGLLVHFSDLEKTRTLITDKLFVSAEDKLFKTYGVSSYPDASHIHNRTDCKEKEPKKDAEVAQISAHKEFDKFTFNTNLIKRIIGHPLTHADLLRAILEHLGSEYRVTIWARSPDTWDIVYRMSQTTSELKISLNHRHIEDIPDTDPMWEQLLAVLTT